MKVKTLSKEFELKFNGSVLALLRKLGLNPVEFLVIVNNELVHELRVLNGDELVEVIPVVSGG